MIGQEVFGRETNPFLLYDGLPPHTGKVRDFAGLQAEVECICAVGFSVLDEDLEAGVVGVSAPVLDHTGRVVAALNVSGPKKRIGDKIDALGGIVRQAGASLSRTLGGPGAYLGLAALAIYCGGGLVLGQCALHALALSDQLPLTVPVTSAPVPGV